jgi:hypothetical protein
MSANIEMPQMLPTNRKKAFSEMLEDVSNGITFSKTKPKTIEKESSRVVYSEIEYEEYLNNLLLQPQGNESDA